MRCLLHHGLVGLVLAAAGACSWAPEQPEAEPDRVPVRRGVGEPGAAARPAPREAPPARAIVSVARSLIDTPYRYGGASPRGFDCSGLVYYVHGRAGIGVPRTAAGQRAAASPVSPGDLRAGDLVFFENVAGKVFHVGIYVGDGRFIHAPETGRGVSYARLDQDFYRRHFAGAGRFR